MDTFPDTPALTVYYDGACALCAAEIRLYRRCRGAERLAWIDVSPDGPADLGPGLTRAQARARLHVRDARGQLASGAAAFLTLWSHLPAWRALAWLRHVPGLPAVAEVGYRAFLPLRPWIARLVPGRAPCASACIPERR